MVLTDQDATAIALTAAVLAAVAGRPRALRAGKVVVAGLGRGVRNEVHPGDDARVARRKRSA